MKVLLIRWLLKQGPIAVGMLADEVGCSYPTIRDALQRLALRQHLKHYSSRAVELARFPHDIWSELVALSPSRRRSIHFVDVSGHKPNPQRLLQRLERNPAPQIAVGGVAAARSGTRLSIFMGCLASIWCCTPLTDWPTWDSSSARSRAHGKSRLQPVASVDDTSAAEVRVSLSGWKRRGVADR